MRDGKGMNVFRKFPLIPYITKELTPCSSLARKVSISFTFNTIALEVRLSPVLSTSARTAPPPRRSPDAHTANIATCAPPTALPICDAEVRFQKVKLLIPGHIPGSFCEFRFSSSHVSLGLAVGWRIHRAFCDVCASLGNPASRRTHGKHRHVCATQSLLWTAAAGRRISFARAPSIRDRSAICETVDSRPHSGFVPNGWALAQPKPASGGAYIAPFAMCASLGNPTSVRTGGRARVVKTNQHACVTLSSFILSHLVPMIDPITSRGGK